MKWVKDDPRREPASPIDEDKIYQWFLIVYETAEEARKQMDEYVNGRGLWAKCRFLP